ncbi:hypothetical protein [Dactylosporangium sp. NPDC005555]|uniref:hypothetical protein n=1 Tax=Dactylosporangium sp. NPDC005555 TaxID=3154889 RepID=UPI00339FD721
MSSTGPAAVLEAAELCAAAGDHADAAHLLADALVTGPADADLLRALAEAQSAIGWDGCALALLAEAHRTAPDDEAVITARNASLREHGRFVEALAVLGTTPHRALRAGTYADMGLPVLAVETDPTGRRGLWWRTGGPVAALRARRRRDEDEILTGLVEAAGPATRTPVDMPALLTRIVNGTDQDRDAIAACRASVEHMDAGRPAEAATVLADALRRDSTHPLLLRRAARVAEQLDRLAPALALYRRITVDPSPVAALVRQGTLLIRMHRLPEAVRFVEGLPAETARALPLRRIVATAHDAAGRPDPQTMAAWPPLPVEDLLGPLATGPAADLMDATASAADTLHRARRADEQGDEQAAVDVLTAATGDGDPQILKELWGRLSRAGREEEALVRAGELAATDPNDVDGVTERIMTLHWLGRTREALDLIAAQPAAVRAAPCVREPRSYLYERHRLPVLALDAIGAGPTASAWQRGRRRLLWWATGGPLWMIRRRMRDADRAALASWQADALPLLSTLDATVPSATAAMRAVVDRQVLDRTTRTLYWRRVTVVAVAAVPLIAGLSLIAAGPAASAVAGHIPVIVLLIVAAQVLAAVLGRVARAWAIRRSRRAEPRAVALTETLALLGELQQVGRRNELRWRRFWLERLERIASAVEHDLPAVFGLVDADTHRRLAEGGQGAARAVRQLKFLVAAPSSADAWRRVEEVLRHNAGALATGELGRLRRAAAVAVPAPLRRSRRAVAVAILRMALFAGLPLVAVYMAQPWLKFSGTVHDWAKVVGLAWALLYVLLHLDPTLREKLGTVLAALSPGEQRPDAVARIRDSGRSAAP